jgi:hypothetical protein
VKLVAGLNPVAPFKNFLNGMQSLMMRDVLKASGQKKKCLSYYTWKINTRIRSMMKSGKDCIVWLKV